METCEDQGEVAMEFVTYFQNLFRTEATSHVEEVLNLINSRVTTQMNVDLIREFSPQEIRRALFDMDPPKAPGVDGMTTRFFQKY